jgi:signal transduction histidine kinase
MLGKVGGSLLLAFLASIFVIVIIGVVTYRSVQSLITINQRVVHTEEVLVGLADIRRSLLQVETDARGFLLTGDPAFDNAYRLHLSEVPVKVAQLKEKTADNLEHQQRFDVLGQAIESRLDLLEEFVQRRQVLGATVIPAGGVAEGKRRMEVLNAALDDIAAAEQKLLEQRLSESDQTGRQLLLTVVLAICSLIALVGLVAFLAFRDISFRKENEAKLRAARDELEDRVRERTAELSDMNTELERSNRELQDFAFVASHDLQEPLRKIQAFGDRLRTVQGPKFDDQGRDYLDRMHSAAERMHTLINDLLTFSRVTTKAQPFEPTDLNKIAKDVVSDLETTIEESGGEVSLGNLPTIDADAVQMRQLLQNLIANALKFKKADTKPTVEVSSEVEDTSLSVSGGNGSRSVSIFVKDNGIGFDEKYLDRIFTPFQRLHGRNEYEGTGIGLAVCRKIVERHGGTLTAKSTPGEGAIFIAILPLTQAKER